jgi:hypothetical protein
MTFNTSPALLCRRVLFAAALVLAATVARADPPLVSAPSGSGTPGAVRQLFLDPKLTDARAITEPEVAVRVESTNNWRVPVILTRGDHTVVAQLDSESDALAFTVRVPWVKLSPGGWRRRVASTLEWRVTEHWGGVEDGAIEAWHRLVGAFNFFRDVYPQDRLNLKLAEQGRAAFDLHSARLAPGDLVVGTQVLLASGGSSRIRGASQGDARWGVTARAELKVPVGRLASAGGSGGTDVGLSLLGTTELSRWFVVHGMVFTTAVSPLDSPISLQPKRIHAGAELSMVAVAGRWGFIVEDRLLSPLMEGGWTVADGGRDDVYLSSPAAALFRPHNQVTFGLRRGRVTLTFSEDFTLGANPRARHQWYYDSNSPDIVLALTFVHRFH